MKVFTIGRIAGLTLSVMPAAVAGSFVLWMVLTTLSALFWLAQGEAILAGFIAVVLHWVSEIVHNLGHGWAARRTGHPMIGIRLGTLGVLATSLYPSDEGELPADVHIKRALGGPAASFLLTLVAGVLVLVLQSVGGWVRWVSLFFFAENLLVFFLGAFLPLGFNDGSTLLHWVRQRE